MPGQSESVIQGPNPLRVLDSRAYLSHHAHVQNGRRRQAGCGFCEKGLDAVVKIIEAPVEEPKLDESDRSDPDGAASHTSRDGGLDDWFNS